MTDPAAIRRFALAGRAVLTLSSGRTGAHYTYRISAPAEPKNYGPNGEDRFVSLLTGPDNGGDYEYLGMIGWSGTSPPIFRLTKGSKMAIGSTPVAAFRFFCDKVLGGGAVPPGLEVRHAGRCGRCGRALTVPESLDTGLGPECAGAMGAEWKKKEAAA